jgi:hypothetical protein
MEKDLPAVIRAVKKIMMAVIRPLVMGMRKRATKAPPMMPNPIGKERRPMPTGSFPVD